MRALTAEDLGQAAVTRLGRYEVLEEIASGGMATVYLARTVGAGGFERVFAVKCCHPHLRADDDFVAMFLDEARLAAKIHHPNVVPVVDVCNEGALYLVMEYVEGDRLSGLTRAAMARGGPLPVPVVARVICDVLRGLHAAHELRDRAGRALNVVHRDVSPQNVLVGVDGAARITDFGIAKAAESSTITREGSLKGKLAYMAPEQIRGGTATQRSDQYAVGVVLWEALTGRRLFTGDGDMAVMKAVRDGMRDPPSRLAPAVPPALDAIVARALSRDPNARFAHCDEFADAIEHAVRLPPAREVANLVRDLAAPSLARRAERLRLHASMVGDSATGVTPEPFAPDGPTFAERATNEGHAVEPVSIASTRAPTATGTAPSPPLPGPASAPTLAPALLPPASTTQSRAAVRAVELPALDAPFEPPTHVRAVAAVDVPKSRAGIWLVGGVLLALTGAGVLVVTLRGGASSSVPPSAATAVRAEPTAAAPSSRSATAEPLASATVTASSSAAVVPSATAAPGAHQGPSVGGASPSGRLVRRPSATPSGTAPGPASEPRLRDPVAQQPHTPSGTADPRRPADDDVPFEK